MSISSLKFMNIGMLVSVPPYFILSFYPFHNIQVYSYFYYQVISMLSSSKVFIHWFKTEFLNSILTVTSVFKNMMSYFNDKILQFWKFLFFQYKLGHDLNWVFLVLVQLHLLIILIGALFLSLYESLPHTIILKFWKTQNCQYSQRNYLNYNIM